MSDLLNQIEKTILARRLFRPSQRILVAVSGGIDSMVLLHALKELSQKHGWQLAVGHFNHQLRGRSSDADERLVRREAEKLKLNFVVDRADVREHARVHKLSVEMAARKLRHDFLARTARELKISHVALAHHADDQVELFFLRLLRGCGGEGLAGMKWLGASPGDPKITLARPLLDQPKTALAAYAKERGIPFREDASNLLIEIPRNRIRRELLPQLTRGYQPALARIISRQMETIGAEAEVVSQLAKQWLQAWDTSEEGAPLSGPVAVGLKSTSKRTPLPNPLPFGRGEGEDFVSAVSHSLARQKGKVAPFERLPAAVQRRCIQIQLIERGIPADFDLIERLRESTDQRITIGVKLSVHRNKHGRLCLEEMYPESFGFGEKKLKLKLRGRAGEFNFDGLRVKWKVDSRRAGTFCAPKTSRDSEKRRDFELFDANKVGKQMVLRHWQPGDRFQPIGMKARVKVQDLFTNQRIPRAQRHQLAVGVTQSGELFWVEGLRLGERFKLDAGTVQQLKWQWKRVGEPRINAVASSKQPC